MSKGGFIPGANVGFLTSSYDRLCRLIGLGEGLRTFELGLVGPVDGRRFLEVGCGTGELLRTIARAGRPARLAGVDPDPAMLAQAEAKLRAAGVQPELTRGFAQALPFAGGTFDVVLSSLMLHHLDGPAKRAALREWRRVLAPSGTLVLVDFGPPRSRLLRALLWPTRFGLFEEVAENMRGRIPALLQEAGFSPREAGRYRGLVVAHVARS
jgi:ubiquinone/menaquinone biosynthesis C-methylase UbiE